MKKFFASKSSGKYISIIFIGFLLLFLSAHFAFAAPPGQAGTGGTNLANSNAPTNSMPSVADFLNDVSYYFVGQVAFGVSYIIAWLSGVIISIEAWLVGAMLGINTGVFQSQIVQKGFGVTLSIANLGFVLGIIIIALATILHRETFGWKKTLWKLIVAAILVNFSLVIAAPIFALGNSFTQYFLNCVDPAGGDCRGQGAGIGLVSQNSMNDFASSLVGAFNPQTGLIPNPNGTFSGSISGNQSASAALGQSLGSLLTPLVSIIFVAFELIAIVIVLGTLIFMLLVRYVYIAVLAILMPFAWLGWVFPNIKDWWSKWWNQFFRWTFFAPIVVFFLYLAIQTQQSMASGTAVASQTFGTYTSTANNQAWAAISTLFTNMFSPIVAQLLNSFVLIGLTIGGLIVADRLSIMGAKAGVDGAKSVGKFVQGYAGKQTKKIGRLAYQKVDKGVASMSKSGLGITQRLKEGRIGAFKYVPLAQRGASLAGRGIEEISTNEKMVEDAKKNVPKDPEKIRSALRGDMNKQDQLAHIAKLIEMGEYKGDEIIHGTGEVRKENEVMRDGTIAKKGTVRGSGQKASDFLDANQENGLIERYGQGKLTKDADKATGSNKAMRDAEKAFRNAAAGSTEAANAMRRLDSATEEFVKKLEKSDMSKMNVNEALSNKDELARALTRNFIRHAPQLVASALPKMKSPTLKNFGELYIEEADQEAFRINNDATLTPAQRSAAQALHKKKRDSFNQALANNALNISGSETPPAAAPTGGGTPPPPHP